MHNVRGGTLKGCLSDISFGEGPPLVVFSGLFASNANPTGLLLRFEMGWLSPLAQSFRVYRINRKVGLAPHTTTMADLASHYATAIEDSFEGAINILGLSTGGSIAQQFAADHPDLVRRLVLAGTACRLGPVARDAQRRHAQFAAWGQYRRSLAALAPTITRSALGQLLAGAAMWLAAPLGGMGPNWDPSDMIATVEAEDAFDASERLGKIRARPSWSVESAIRATRESCSKKRREAFRSRGCSSIWGVVTAALSPIGVWLEMLQLSLFEPGAQRHAEIIPNTNN